MFLTQNWNIRRTQSRRSDHVVLNVCSIPSTVPFFPSSAPFLVLMVALASAASSLDLILLFSLVPALPLFGTVPLWVGMALTGSQSHLVCGRVQCLSGWMERSDLGARVTEPLHVQGVPLPDGMHPRSEDSGLPHIYEMGNVPLFLHRWGEPN